MDCSRTFIPGLALFLLIVGCSKLMGPPDDEFVGDALGTSAAGGQAEHRSLAPKSPALAPPPAGNSAAAPTVGTTELPSFPAEAFGASGTPGDAQMPTRIQVAHLLIAYKQARAAPSSVTREKAEAWGLALELRERITVKGFEELALAHSDDRGSRARGGVVGWLEPGVAEPSFEQAAFALAPGELSSVIETPYGMHIILRLQ